MSHSTTRFVDYKAVKAAVSIVQILEHYNLLQSFRQSGDSYSGVCPLHNGENPTQFRVSISKNCWNCFGKCKRGGNVIDFVSLKENIGFREAALRIQEWFHLESKAPEKSGRQPEAAAEKPTKEAAKPTEKKLAPASPTDPAKEDEAVTENKPLGFVLNQLDPSHHYLMERGLTMETIKVFGLGFCAKGVMADRIAIPIHNTAGQLVAYVGRWPGVPPDGKGKYKLPKGFRKSLEVFNYHRAAQSDPTKPLVVVEGFFDCMRLWQAGYQRVVSIMGSSLSEAQAELLITLIGGGGRLLILFDEDDAGREGRAKAFTTLAPHIYVKASSCGTEGSQPDLLSSEALTKLLT